MRSALFVTISFICLSGQSISAQPAIIEAGDPNASGLTVREALMVMELVPCQQKIAIAQSIDPTLLTNRLVIELLRRLDGCGR